MKPERKIRDIEYLFPQIRKLLEKIYGERLVDIILYGSFAKNNATKESDIDIAVVLKGSVDKIKEIKRIHHSLYALTLEYGELISVTPISEKELNDTEWPLYHHIKNEGIKI